MRPLALFLLFSFSGSAATILVGPSRAITTIQGGVNAASPGDTVSVDPGSYPESVTISKTLTLTGGDAGGAGFTLSAGTLTVNGNFLSSGISVRPGATLTGSGRLGSIIMAGGTIAGTLSAANDIFAANSTFQTVISSATLFDKLTAGGTVHLDGTATLNVSFGDGFTPTVGQTFQIIPGAVSGTFSGLPQDGTLTVNGVMLRIHYASATLTVISPSSTPVPAVSTIGLLVLALGLMGMLARRYSFS